MSMTILVSLSYNPLIRIYNGEIRPSLGFSLISKTYRMLIKRIVGVEELMIVKLDESMPKDKYRSLVDVDDYEIEVIRKKIQYMEIGETPRVKDQEKSKSITSMK